MPNSVLNILSMMVLWGQSPATEVCPPPELREKSRLETESESAWMVAEAMGMDEITQE